MTGQAAGGSTGAGERSGTPARGYSWSPAEPGNDLALRHGAHSARVIDPRAAALVAQVLADGASAYLRQPAYAAALRAWSRAEVRADVLEEALTKHEEGCAGCVTCASWLDQLRRWDTNAQTHRARLGLDPLSRARLGRDVAAARVDLARAWAEQHEQEEGKT